MQCILKSCLYSEHPLQCPLPKGDNGWLPCPCVSDTLWWLLYWLTSFVFFLISFFFKGPLSWKMAAAAPFIDLTAFQGSFTNPQCALQQSPHHPSWWPKPQDLMYRSNIVFSRRQRLTWLDQCESRAQWITMWPMDNKSMTQGWRWSNFCTAWLFYVNCLTSRNKTSFFFSVPLTTIVGV